MHKTTLFSKCLFLIFIQLLVFSAFASAEKLALPSAAKRRAMILNLSQEILRLDGEGLIPRVNRPESWEVTLQRLAQEASEAKDLYALGRVFKKVDATYPNLHAKLFMIPELDERKTEGNIELPIKFFPVSADRRFNGSKFKISTLKNIKSDFRDGDEIISINSRPIQDWTDVDWTPKTGQVLG